VATAPEQIGNWTEVLKKLDGIKQRIDRAGTPAEAEAATAAFTRILAKYDLDQIEVERRLGIKTELVKKLFHTSDYNIGKANGYRRQLMVTLAQAHGCRFYFNSAGWGWLLGPERTIPIVLDLFAIIQKRIKEMAIKWWDDRIAELGLAEYRRLLLYGGGLSDIRTIKESYRRGIIEGIFIKLNEANVTAEIEAGWGLVAVRDAKLDEAEKELMGDIKQQDDSYSYNEAARYEGIRTGYQMHLGKEIAA
jgi:hypothetical protein